MCFLVGLDWAHSVLYFSYYYFIYVFPFAIDDCVYIVNSVFFVSEK